MEVDTQVMIITIAFLTQKNVTVQLWTYFWPPPVCMWVCVYTHMYTHVHTCTHTYKALLWQIVSCNSDCSSPSLSCGKRGHVPSPLYQWEGACDHSTVMLRDFLGCVMVMG